jgi:glycosyltransferase involved in cell wall biosynthesis
LNDTKISLCPLGFLGPETFRSYESIKMGCIVVSATMPANALYQPDPGFQVEDINDVDRLAEVSSSILQRRAEYDVLQQRFARRLGRAISPKAVAEAIAKTAVGKNK